MSRHYNTKNRPESQLSIIRMALPGSQHDIVERTGVSRVTVLRWLDFLRQAGEAHIGAWEHTKTRPRPIYHAGFGADVVCSEALPKTDDRAKAVEARERRC